MNCRHCGTKLGNRFLDLGFAPPSNAYLTLGDLNAPEVHFPLRLFVCDQCWLVQTEDYSRPEELFRADYAYFSSVSQSWLQHAAAYSEMITRRLGLNSSSMVVEIASNDGYLLKNFVASGIPCLGIEPTECTAAQAELHGVKVLRKFFGAELGRELAQETGSADLIIGNNVFAHVPDINDFTAGLKHLLKRDGTITLEFPHLMRLMEHLQFDTVYHEHYSYLSLFTVGAILERAGLRIYDVEELPTHGGSLRVFASHADDDRGATAAVAAVLEEEERRGLRDLETYRHFQRKVESVKDELLEFLIREKRAGRKVIGYGAAAKGNTLFNFAGVGTDLVKFICDAALSKQNHYTPGGHIPIMAPAAMREARPDTILILPWNLAGEILGLCGDARDWGARFYVAIPRLRELV
jgi:SAM-dependent methyltransferase